MAPFTRLMDAVRSVPEWMLDFAAESTKAVSLFGLVGPI